MQFTFQYSEPALIEHQLYIASKSPMVKKSRNRNRYLLAIIYVVIGIIGLLMGHGSLAFLFLLIGASWYTLYPLWGGKFYEKHFVKFVKANNKNRIGEPVSISFKDNEITLSEQGQEVSFSMDEFSEIAELPQIFLIKLQTDMVIILQKNATIDAESIAAFLRTIAQEKNISFIDDTNWKWK